MSHLPSETSKSVSFNDGIWRFQLDESQATTFFFKEWTDKPQQIKIESK